MRISDLSAACCKALAQPSKDYSPETIDTYQRAHQQFIGWLRQHGGRDDVEDFTGDNVEAFIDAFAERGAKAATLTKTLAALSALAKYGMRVKVGANKYLLVTDPTKMFDWPSAPAEERPFLTPDQLAAFVAVPLERHDAYVRDFLLETGLRAGQCCRLTVGGLLEVEGALFVSASLKGRGGRRRHKDVPLSPELARATWERLVARGIDHLDPEDERPLLCDANGGALKRDDLYRLTVRVGKLAMIGKRAAIPFLVGPHTLRHTVKVILDRAELAEHVQSRLMTHNSPRSIHAYRHHLPADLMAARLQQREAMARYMGRPLASASEGCAHVCAACGAGFALAREKG